MSTLLFPAASFSAVPVRGRPERIPIRRIFCVGRNYEAHAKEMGVAVDRELVAVIGAPAFRTAGSIAGVGTITLTIGAPL
jgi:2-keto-4-pentenoate hydratase/2-oxohepta-3-ene-1,7-dioic acid hydratase in catechol pathway